MVPGARFTNDFLPEIQILWKFRLVVISLLVIRSQQLFAHTTTTQLSCQFCSDHCTRIEVRMKRKFPSTLHCDGKTDSETGPRIVFSVMVDWVICPILHMSLSRCREDLTGGRDQWLDVAFNGLNCNYCVSATIYSTFIKELGSQVG